MKKIFAILALALLTEGVGAQTYTVPATKIILNDSAVVGAGTWKDIANERTNFTLTKATQVRFGKGTGWVYKSFAAGTFPCTLVGFNITTDAADPSYGNAKTCQTLQ